MADPTSTTPNSTPGASTAPAKPSPGATTPGNLPDGTKVIADGVSYSKRVARDLAKIDKDKKEIERQNKELKEKTDKLKAYEDSRALIKAGKIKEFLQSTGLTREQVAKIYGFDLSTGKPVTTPATAAKPPESNEDILSMKAELKRISDERAAEKKAAEDKKKADEAATFEANKKWFLDKIATEVGGKAEEFAYTALALEEDPAEVREFMWEVVDAWCKANPDKKDVPAPEVFARAVEEDYEKEAARYSRVTKKPREVAPIAATKPTTTPSGTTPTKPLTESQAREKAKRDWEALKKG